MCVRSHRDSKADGIICTPLEDLVVRVLTVLVTVLLLCWNTTIAKTPCKRKHLPRDLPKVSDVESLTVTVGSTAETGRQVLKQSLEAYKLTLQSGHRENWTGLAWSSEVSKPNTNDTASPTRPHLLILPKQFQQLRPSSHICEPVGLFSFSPPHFVKEGSHILFWLFGCLTILVFQGFLLMRVCSRLQCCLWIPEFRFCVLLWNVYVLPGL